MAVRVVVVDDSPEFRTLLRVMLGRQGDFEVVGEAGDGDAAVPLVAELQPDLVLLDVSMPSVTGPAALVRIREAAPGARVVMLSGYGDRSEVAAECVAAGAVGFLEKGSGMRAMLDRLRELLG